MKRIYIAIMATVFASCAADYVPFEVQGLYTSSPSLVSDVTSEALPGEIKLRWNMPQDKHYYFLRVSYYDPLMKKEICRLASASVDTMMITNTRARFGEYEFKLQTFNSKNEGSELQITKAFSGKAPSLETIASETKVPLVAEQLSLNVTPTEGVVADLVDDNPATYINTPYQGVDMEKAPFWLQVNLKAPLLNFRVAYAMPSSKGTGPKRVTIKISQNGNDWSDLTSITSGLVNAKGTSWRSDVFRAEKPFSYLRWVVEESTSGGKYAWNLGGFSLYGIEFHVYDPETVPLD